jgi:hypothetical protein
MEPVCTIAPPRPAGLHGLRSSLGGEELAFKDDVEEAVVLKLVDLEERLRREDAGVVEEHVNATKLADRRLHHCITRCR